MLETNVNIDTYEEDVEVVDVTAAVYAKEPQYPKFSVQSKNPVTVAEFPIVYV